MYVFTQVEHETNFWHMKAEIKARWVDPLQGYFSKIVEALSFWHFLCGAPWERDKNYSLSPLNWEAGISWKNITREESQERVNLVLTNAWDLDS